MNNNAMTKKSTIKIKETATGKANVGFRRTDGVIMSGEKYFAELKKNGYTIEQTENGIIITPPSK